MIKYIINLLRIQQWYKNLLIFVAIFFAGKIFDGGLLLNTLVGFLSLCLISSASYIINDIKDIKQDLLHPEKKIRPIASRRISVMLVATISVILLILSLILASFLKPFFILFPLVLFANSIFYTFYFKNIAILDIHVIALNYLIRATAGAVIISVVISPWFILFIFLLALFLAIGKRRGELSLLKEKAEKYRRVYAVYNEQFLDWLMIILLGVMFFSYILYTFMAYKTYHMMLTIPFVSFLIFRYLYLISINHEIARKTEYFFKDKQLVTVLILWLVVSFAGIYKVI